MTAIVTGAASGVGRTITIRSAPPELMLMKHCGPSVFHAGEVVPGLAWKITPGAEGDIVIDPTRKGRCWGAYDISRICGETRWRPMPMPLPQALGQYTNFLRSSGAKP